jgi:hypothetical protein
MYNLFEDFEEFQDIIDEMRTVYMHDKRPWMIGYSGGKDSTLLCELVFQMLRSLQPEERIKKVYTVTSDTRVENPIVRNYMHRMVNAINETSKAEHLKIEAHIIYPEINQSFWSLVIGLGYPTPEAPGFRWCTERLKINPSNEVATMINNQAKLNDTESAYVRIAFSEEGIDTDHYDVMRRWTWNGGSIEEHFVVEKNGIQLDEEAIVDFNMTFFICYRLFRIALL